MARIPEGFIEELKNKTDLVRYVKQYTQLKKVGRGVWQGQCPHPKHSDNTPSFTVWEKQKSWACFGCHKGKKGEDGNVGSDIIAFIQWIDNIDFRKAVEKLAEWNNVSIPTDEHQKLYDQNYKLARKYQQDLYNKYEYVLDYLYDRGLDDIDIEHWMIGYDSFKNRIVFPLFDRYNNIIGFNKRVIDPDYNGGDKYINSSNSKIFNKSYFLYGMQEIDNDFNEIRITEGSFDVILGRKYGIKNLVASLGTSFTEHHAEIIAKTGKTPVLIFDGDEAGNKALKKALFYFEQLGVYCKIVNLPKGKDLANMTDDIGYNVNTYIKDKSMTAGYFIVKDIIQQYQSSLYELKLKTIPQLEKALENIPLSEKRPIKNFIKDEINLTIE